jgi:hypothetical protein
MKEFEQMGQIPGTIWIALIVLIVFLLIDILYPKSLSEGFKVLVGSNVEPVDGSGNYFSKYFPKRGDVGPFKEETNFIMDPRYFHDYVDVQGLGFKHDYCRLVIPENAIQDSLSRVKVTDETKNQKLFGEYANAFIACALAGTGNTPTASFKSKTVSNGLQLSRDDYMRDIYNDNRYAYCRILKKDNVFQPLCIRATPFGFNEKEEVDPNPTPEILDLLNFYDGCVAWLRLYDDMIDYTKNLVIGKIGNISIPEDPNPSVTNGLSFNGIDQYLRISDNPDLTLGRVIHLRSVRAFSVWAYFDEFANNSHIFDFGNGAGDGNVFLGILGSGDPEGSSNEERPLLCGSQQNTLPNYPSGPHPCAETTPQNLMLLKANVNEYECKLFDVPPDYSVENEAKKVENKPTRATLLYEVWYGKQRKMRIKLNKVIPLKKWVHIAITAKANDSFRPDIAVYINGTQVFVQPSGFLVQTKGSSNNYLGKSNWSNQTSSYELRDELFSGKLFDFRMYNTVMSEEKIKKTIMYGQKKLGI